MLNSQYTKIQLCQKHFWENLKISDHKYQFWILKIILFFAEIGHLVKLLSNHKATFSPENLENISNFEGWGLTLAAYKKSILNEIQHSKIDKKPWRGDCSSLLMIVFQFTRVWFVLKNLRKLVLFLLSFLDEKFDIHFSIQIGSLLPL